ncbi:hypothetical protein ACQR1Y_31355 [Bradyrhizobium sp. HKCCYLRH3099]|uniref:hypothetical protein n=1 Tax=unclassified Bradyrhizobium TaxID=2631580 RepID=UPI003EBA63D4
MVGSLVTKDGQGAPKTPANINNLMRFLDAFKAAPLVWPDCGGARIVHRVRHPVDPGDADRCDC